MKTEKTAAIAVTEKAQKKRGVSKVLIMALMLAVVCCAGVFADDAATVMQKSISNILSLFQSPWVKGFAALAFIAECIGLIFAGGQNPQIFKKFLPLMVGTVLFMCAGKIVDLVFGDESWATEPTYSKGMLLPDTQTQDMPSIDGVMFIHDTLA